jgi:hypothetical protein
MKRISYKMSFRKTLSLMLLFIALAFVLNSCYPGEELTYEDTDIVATVYDTEADFSTKLTYALRDTIARVDGDGNLEFEPEAADQQILDKIESELQAIGFTEAASYDVADVLVAAAISQSTWVGGGCYYGWYSYWYPYYGWCYPTYYTYDTGSLLIVMGDGDVPPPAGGGTVEKEGLWVAVINGLLGDNSSSTLNRVLSNIEQAFDQSPYLAEGK